MPFLAPIAAGIAGTVGAGAATAGAIGAGVSGIAGGIAGAVQGGAGRNATASEQMQINAFNQQQQAINAGPGLQDIQAGNQSARDFAGELATYANTDFTAGPSAADLSSSQQLAGNLFQAQRVGVRQNFLEQQQQFANTAALTGRGPLDPVFRNKQAQEQERQLGMLDAQQNSFATERAMGLNRQRAQDRLGFLQQRDQVLSGLATQAMANRQALTAMGSAIGKNQVRGQGEGGGFAGALEGFTGASGSSLEVGRNLSPFGFQAGQALKQAFQKKPSLAELAVNARSDF